MVPSPIKIHPFTLCSKYKWDDDDLFDACVEFLEEQGLLQERCHSKLRSKELLCSCMSFFCRDNEFEPQFLTLAAARYMVYFARMNRGLQQAIVVDWIRYSKHTSPSTHPNCVFLMPIMNGSDLLELHDQEANITQPPRVCCTFIMNILNIGKMYWFTCRDAAVMGVPIPEHGLVGKPSNRSKQFNATIADDLFLYFEGVCMLATPSATRFIRDITGETSTRDDDIDILEIEPYNSKRGLFNRFCHERGWDISTSHKGIMEQKERTDAQWISDGEPVSAICCWPTFLSFWKKHYPKLRIRAPSADTCGDCHKFHNEARHVQDNTFVINNQQQQVVPVAAAVTINEQLDQQNEQMSELILVDATTL